MNRWWKCGLLTLVFSFLATTRCLAYDFQINNFESEIRLEEDSSLRVLEKIETKFFVERHGIIRIIPYVYTYKGKTIRAEIKILGVSNDEGNKVAYTVKNLRQSKQIRIGEADRTIIGEKNYLIEYVIKGVVLDYGEGPEIYWNVTGNEWAVPIIEVKARVESPFGKIVRTECFGCNSKNAENEAEFTGSKNLTIVVQIDKENKLKMPTEIEKTANLVKDNWGYIVAILPLLVALIAWIKKGRDKKYLTENVFYRPDDKTSKNKPLLSRPHLPMVYGPIDGLTPSEVGTIIDEKLDTKDVVAEIVELARLGFLTIKKIEKKGIFGIGRNDYELQETKKETSKLNKFQKDLLESLFESGSGISVERIIKKVLEDGIGKVSESENGLEILKKKDDGKTKESSLFKITGVEKSKKVGEIRIVKISELKNKFYTHLKDLRSEMYKTLADKKMTDGDLEKVKTKWMGIISLLSVGAFLLIATVFLPMTENFGPMMVLMVLMVPSLILANKMPRKTAWGYSMARQAEGLRYYLSKGKWREEIFEKRLFLEEMLPLAISLGVVEKLARDMKNLGIEPPKYFQGMAMNSFARDLNNFNSATTSGLTSSPSGSSSWSGGSGFSGGGHSGGGFGGGGGGSW